MIDPDKYDILDGVRHGAYVLQDGGTSADVVLIATGSEVSLILKAAAALEAKGTHARVVSMPQLDACLREQSRGLSTEDPASTGSAETGCGSGQPDRLVEDCRG